MRIAILLLLLVTLGGFFEVTTAQGRELQLVGETVTISYVADPSLGRGQFRLENVGETVVKAVVNDAWLQIGDDRQPLSDFDVFDLDHEQMIRPESFEVGAETTLRFLLTFPRRTHSPRFGEKIYVGLRLAVNETELHALSPIELERRIPYGH